MMLDDLCREERCIELSFCKGLCRRHYMRQHRAAQTKSEAVKARTLLKRAVRRFMRAQLAGHLPSTPVVDVVRSFLGEGT